MGKHLRDAIIVLMKMLMELSGIVEKNVSMAFDALTNLDMEIAKKVIEKDIDIDKEEIRIEEECLKILALHQPVASDLRYIITVLKINNDLERIGDLAQDISEHIINLLNHPVKFHETNFNDMFNAVSDMLRDSINSVINMDKDLALKVIKRDDFIDNKNREICEFLSNEIIVNPKNTAYFLQKIYISRRLERIADLATNIAEDTIYLVSGEIVRHNKSIKT